MSRVHIKREALICTNEQDALETISAFWRQPPGFENIKEITIVKGTEEDKSFYNSLLAEMFSETNPHNLI